MKKIIPIIAMLLAVSLFVPSCVSRGGTDEETTTTPIDYNNPFDDIMDKYKDGTTVVASVIYKECDDHVEVVGCENPFGEVSILSEYKGKPVTVIADNAFQGLITITSVAIPEGVKTIGEKAFMACNALTSVIIPDSVETIGRYAFYGCYSLTDLELGTNLNKVGTNAFGFCNLLSQIKVKATNTSFSSVDGVLFSADKTQLVCYPTGKTGDHYTVPSTVKTISPFAFAYAANLKSVGMSAVTSIGDYALSSCDKLNAIELGSGLTGIGAGVFQKCTSLATVTIPEGVTSIGYKDSAGNECGSAFYKCTGLTTVNLPSTLKNIYLRSFEGCEALKTVNFAGTKAQWDSVTVGEDNEPIKSATLNTK